MGSYGCIVGPFIEYSDFKNWIELKSHYKDLPRGLFSGWAVFLPALKDLGAGFLCLAIHILFAVVLGYSAYFPGKKEYLEYGNFFNRVWYYHVAMTGQRFMYYTPWCITDSAVKSCGLSYNGSTKEKDGTVTHKFDRIISIFIIALETA